MQRLKAVVRNGRLVVDEPTAPPEGTEIELVPVDDGLDPDERARLLAALDGLPDQQRLVLACRHLLDLSEAETAAALGVRVGTVKSRASRALDALRETYGP